MPECFCEYVACMEGAPSVYEQSYDPLLPMPCINESSKALRADSVHSHKDKLRRVLALRLRRHVSAR
jgi:hypothetical protein